MKNNLSEICEVRSSSLISAAITAERQTSANGRFPFRKWKSIPESFSTAFLVPLHDQVPRNKWGVFPLMAASSILSTVQSFCITQNDNLCLKWPNDVLLNGKKIGISIVETIDSHCEWGFAIISIHINLNNSQIKYDSKNQFMFATVEDACGKKINSNQFFLKLSKQLSDDIKLVFMRKEELFTKAHKKWTSNASQLAFEYDNKKFLGTPVDVFADGSLVIHTDSNQQIIINSNEVFETFITENII